MKKLSWLFIAVFLLGAGVRAINVWRPVDRTSWRENDEAGIAQNFYTEDMNILYPRVDWRGDTPGFAEMEFPVYPWLTALTYKIFGQHEFLGRVLSYIFSLLTLIFFFQLARYLLPPVAALIASLFFALSPITIYIATSLQPEAMMFMFYVLAAYAFIRWHEEDNEKFFWLACGATTMAMLSKAPAAHIGLFFGFLIWKKHGLSALRQGKLWIFAAITLVPNLLWYRHAHSFWLRYRNSLGVSNEYHWVGKDFFTNKAFLLGILRSESFYVMMPTGLLLLGLVLYFRHREKAVQYSLAWLASAFVFYLLAARTTSDQWAFYYHVASVPAVALLLGQVAEILQTMRAQPKKIFAFATSFLLFVTFLFQARQIYADARTWQPSPLKACAEHFADLIPPKDLILVTGGVCTDEDGYPVAYNASFMIYWAQRKGFNVCIEEQSLESIVQFKQRGAKYFLAAKSTFRNKKQLESDLRQTYPVLAECDDYFLLQLTPHPTRN